MIHIYITPFIQIQQTRKGLPNADINNCIAGIHKVRKHKQTAFKLFLYKMCLCRADAKWFILRMVQYHNIKICVNYRYKRIYFVNHDFLAYFPILFNFVEFTCLVSCKYLLKTYFRHLWNILIPCIKLEKFFWCRYPCLKISLVYFKVQLTTDVDTTQRG